MRKTNLTLAGTLLVLAAGSVSAQEIFDTAGDAQDRNTALNEAIADDFERSTTQFGNEGRKLGFDGSVAMQANATSGNSDTASVGIGANFGYYDGTNGYDFQLSYQYSEDEGETSEDSLLYDFEYTRDFGAATYGFAKLTGTVDSFPLETSDTFLGFGLGYRVIDTASTQWSLQAGPGYRVADLGGVGDLDEGALSVSSNYYQQISDTLALTNDTDIIASEGDTVLYNDLGVNVSMTDTLALRTSVVTEYHTDPAAGLDDTDNTFGVSLVYSFD